ncbi:MAG: primosomal protein N' [Candidatus Endonucleobacter sp. (ex Gigantidas childressi)]|nr:primosomal protein N' [Candidatus Endonucleobacter sp. (ex Gigantidas childressi)]
MITSSQDPTSCTHVFVQVAIPSPLRRLFDYLSPKNYSSENIEQTIKPGTRVLVSFGRRQLTGVIVSTSNNSSISANKLKPIIKVLDKEPIIPEVIMKLCQWVANYYHYSLGETLMQAMPKTLRQGKPLPVYTTTMWSLLQPLCADQQQLQRAQKQLAAAQLLNNSENLSLSEENLKNAGISKSTLKALSDKGLISAHEIQTKEKKFTDQPSIETEQAFTLNHEQQIALNSISEQFHSYNPIVLDGITGSGKTEVYLQAITTALKENKQSLVLIPEIGLTPQTLGRFKKRFNTPVVCLHSGLSDSDRLSGWHQAFNETAGIIITTRSGVFTPLPNLGLIIVDEEHDSSYKQQDTLRYNARDLAIYRAKQVNCPIILGSATPSLETFYNATSGRFKHLTLRQRAGQARPPQIELLDMRKQNQKNGLALDLVSRMANQLTDGNQVMVFLNRRGYAPSVICHDCGTVVDCHHCDAHMTIHRHPPRMHCHHCDFQIPIPNLCQSCKSTNIQPAGQGTERSEQDLTQLFPNYPVIRVDRDSTRKKNALNSILNTINSGQPCILLGTQMLAKGHHFPGVTLVIILNADSGLFSSDFRGLERTGQLIMQVSGRAGRGNKAGQVVIQTCNPQHTILQTLTTNNYTQLLETLLTERKALKLPPFEHLAMVRVESANSKECEILLQEARQFVELNAPSNDFQTLGPIPAPMEKKQGRYRWQLLNKSSQRSTLHKIIHVLLQYLENKKLPRHIRWSIDVDPQDMS